MKIALFSDIFYPTVGGTETVVQELGEAFFKDGDNVFVAAPKEKQKTPDEEIFDFQVKRCHAIKVSSNDYLAFPSLDKKFKRGLPQDIDIIHCHSTAAMADYGYKLAKKLGVPFVYTVHTKLRDALSRHIKIKFIVNMVIKNMVKKLYKADMVYTVSDNMAQELKKYGYDGPVQVVRNGVSLKPTFDKDMLAAELKTQYNLKNNVPVFLFVGRIIAYKNLEFTLNVLKTLHEDGRDFKMFFVGEGPDRHKFEKLSQEFGLEENIVFTGNISDWRELSKYYAAADLFIFPSIFDNDSIAMLEANSYETPCIVIENTGSSERITDGKNGFICENSHEAFVKKISSLIDDPSLLAAAGAQAKISNCASWIEVCRVYKEKYREVIENKAQQKSPEK